MTEKQNEWTTFILACAVEGVDFKFEEPSTVFGTTVLKISVPEKNTTEENYSPTQLMKEIKEEFSNYIYTICDAESEEEKEEAKKLFKVLGKIRNETWTQDKVDAKLAQLKQELDLIKNLGGYEEI